MSAVPPASEPSASPPAAAAVRCIAVDIDDTLNDFGETLRTSEFPFEAGYELPEATFRDFLARVRAGEPEPSDLLSTQYSYFRYKIHAECYRRAHARPDAVEFMRWLRAEGWRIVICTHRDLRRTLDVTRRWLAEAGIPYDHLFMALNKIVFCRAWGIPILIDDDPFNLAYGAQYGVRVFHPVLPKHAGLPDHGARGFRTFGEVKAWIR